jgi:hypothetical protein
VQPHPRRRLRLIGDPDQVERDGDADEVQRVEHVGLKGVDQRVQRPVAGPRDAVDAEHVEPDLQRDGFSSADCAVRSTAAMIACASRP